MLEDILTLKEAAELSGRSQQTLRLAIWAGALRPLPLSQKVKVYLFSPAEVIRWGEENPKAQGKRTCRIRVTA